MSDIKSSEIKNIGTWDGRSTFSYRGSVGEGTRIFYGTSQKIFVSSAIYEMMLNHFKGRIVDCGTSRTNPQLGSLGEWLKENLSKTALASYVGAILVKEGYAYKKGSKIKFE